MRYLSLFAVLPLVRFTIPFSIPMSCRIRVIVSVDNRKEAMKDEQWKIQQDMLARRKNKTNMKKYFGKVEDNRKDLSAKAQDTIWARTKDNIDPIEKWKSARDSGKIKSIGYEPEPSRNASRLGFNVIIPINPMGIPKYDNGERFDLRLPYAERGYEDESADFMGNVMRGFRNIFGKSKSSGNTEPTTNAASKDTKKT